MEKFSDYRDKGTGISPFMPTSHPATNGPIAKYLLNPLIFLIKLPILLILLVLLLFSAPLTPLYKSVIRLILLLQFSISEIELLVDGVKKSNTKTIDEKTPNRGDLVFINFSSPFDAFVLYLISKTADVVFLSAGYNGEVREIGGLLDCFSFALKAPVLMEIGKTVKDLSKYKQKVVYFIVEGTTSNNKSILTVPSKFNLSSFIADCNEVGFNFRAISAKSFPNYVIPTPIPQSLLSYLYLNSSSLQMDHKFKLKLFELPADGSFKVDDIREKLSNYGRLKLTGTELDMKKKVEFIAAYNSSGSGQ